MSGRRNINVMSQRTHMKSNQVHVQSTSHENLTDVMQSIHMCISMIEATDDCEILYNLIHNLDRKPFKFNIIMLLCCRTPLYLCRKKRPETRNHSKAKAKAKAKPNKRKRKQLLPVPFFPSSPPCLFHPYICICMKQSKQTHPSAIYPDRPLYQDFGPFVSWDIHFSIPKMVFCPCSYSYS